MSNETKVRCWKTALREIQEKLPSHITKYLAKKYPEEVLLLCTDRFTEVFILNARMTEAVDKALTYGVTPYSAGLYLGRIRKGKPQFIPSTNILHEIYHETGEVVNALIVAEEGLKPFLYGGDILKKSVINCHEPVRKGDVVAVLGADMLIYGLGLSKIGSCDELGSKKDLEEVASNIFDVGWYIRGEVRKERKYKA